jgi:hypothetical protein
MGVCLRANETRCRDKPNNQETLHSGSSLTEPEFLKEKS